MEKNPTIAKKYDEIINITLPNISNELQKYINPTNTIKYELQTSIFIFDILFRLDIIYDFITQLLNNGNITQLLISDMSETFVNTVYTNKRQILDAINKSYNYIHNYNWWNIIAEYYADNIKIYQLQQNTENIKVNKLVIYLIKRNIHLLSDADNSKFLIL